MALRLALASAIIIILVAVPLPAQELGVGGGWFQPNPLGGGWNGPRGPSIDLTLTDWNGGLGWTLGGTSIFGRNDLGVTGRPNVYAFVGGRARRMNSDGRGFIHVGVGAGPLFWPSDPAFRPETQIILRWHIEAGVTRELRDGLHLRTGVSVMPLGFRPLSVHPGARLVWTFGN
ncbi:MAG: hypothetical protein OXH69_25200 [Acidobacteria bacterium]|nr:hypothetical protein [Acidobacteriota bacterium]